MAEDHLPEGGSSAIFCFWQAFCRLSFSITIGDFYKLNP